ncbi:MAG TPA: SAM-dependent methyltransferase [Streptosporangiaceae bacterium]|nr:SAM-dependent methyltransferase [Streptosporangiaceae bacterium]
MTGNESVPGIDPCQAAPGRMYDYLLGGKDNFAADRELAERLVAVAPHSRWIVRQNRAFVERAVRYCAERGLRQFLDLGCGLPTTDPVHEIARRVDPTCRVVYVDNDPVIARHAQALLAASTTGVAAIRRDVRRPKEILCHDDVRALIDVTRPVAVLLAAVLHNVTDDDDPAAIVAHAMADLAPGSHLVLSHPTHDVLPGQAARAKELYRCTGAPLVTRSRHEVGALFAGLELVAPGLVFTAEWRAEREIDRPGLSGMYAAVARKPDTPGPARQPDRRAAG